MTLDAEPHRVAVGFQLIVNESERRLAILTRDQIHRTAQVFREVLEAFTPASVLAP